MRGYSPQLLSLQSSLNARRPPGAPTLIETGKLDYATLSYPSHAMRYDLKYLEERLRRERISRLARMAGSTPSERDLQDPELEGKLRTAAASLPPCLNAARGAHRESPRRRRLSGCRRGQKQEPRPSPKLCLHRAGPRSEGNLALDAAAALRKNSLLETEEDFLTPELLSAIDAVPAPAPTREAYRKRGTTFKDKYAAAKSNAQKAQSLLESERWATTLAEVDRLIAADRSLRRNLLRDTNVFSRVPWRIAESRASQTRWREVLDNLAMKWAPGTAFARAVALRRNRLSRYLGVFSQVAAGDLDAAAQSFSSAEAVRRLDGFRPSAGRGGKSHPSDRMRSPPSRRWPREDS